MHKTKALSGLKITDEDQGKVTAVFATLGVKDKDGDVTVPGAFTNGAKVRISAYNHASWGPGALPVGKGVIREEGDEVILEGEFFLSTQVGRDTFETVKQLDDLGEWSYGYDIEDAEAGTQDGESVQFLKELTVHEVSPVILGAGVNTRTLLAKGEKLLESTLFRNLSGAGRERFGSDDTYVYIDDIELDEGWVVFYIYEEDEPVRYVRVGYSVDSAGEVTLAEEEEEVQRTTEYAPKGRKKLSKQLESVVADVKAVTDRVADVVAKRAEKGKGLGAASQEAAAELEPVLKQLTDLLSKADEQPETEVKALGDGALDIEAELAGHAARLRL